MKKKLLMIVSLAITMFALASCTLESVDSIEIVGAIQTEYELDEKMDLSKITIRVWDDGKSYEINGTNSLLKIDGFDTSTTGSKTMTMRYEGARLSVNYVVYSGVTTADTSAKLLSLVEQKVSPIRLANSNPIENVSINVDYPLVITGSGSQELSKATITGNVTLQSVIVNGLTVNGLIAPAYSQISLENCKVVAEGYSNKHNGIVCNKSVKLSISDCTFTTESESDCFYYVISNNVSGSTTTIKNTTIVCNFWYGISASDNLEIDNCTIDSTLSDTTPLKDSNGASLYNPNKNPVALHSNISSEQLNYSIKNTTFKNLQNLIRAYGYDKISNEKFEFVWENNDYSTNVNYLINCSSVSHASAEKIAEKMGVQIANIRNRYVAAQNTALEKVGEITVEVRGSYYLYTGLQYINRDGSVYKYLAVNGGNHYLEQDDKYYKMTIAYSSDGLDTRTLAEITELPF